MASDVYLSYWYTVSPFSEKELAAVIRFHPEELRPISDVVTRDSWDKIIACLNFIKDFTDEVYPRYKETLAQNLIKAKEHNDETRKNRIENELPAYDPNDSPWEQERKDFNQKCIGLILTKIKDEDFAASLKYFPEWALPASKELSAERKDKMETYIESCKFSEEEAFRVILRIENNLLRMVREKQTKDDEEVLKSWGEI
jgi:hypothetical protein